ncbi:juvenile hormone esterase-like [Planococcus citri]|uniref:juvenile hormone esterase-like n=1 Tax=Planococcus citri TaxID=170843 RepID=UPI0031F8F4DA
MSETYKNGIIRSLLLLFFIFETVRSAVYIDTKLGHIKGTKGTSRDGKKFNIFLKIPYAQPPLGKLRFRNPAPVQPWNGTLDGTIHPPLCPQLLPVALLGDEDCLYLNVYTPSVEKDAKLPVLIWIHPGRRLFGDALPSHYGPEYFMDKPMIIITANYRLGGLGFFSTEDEAASGNWGLKDQSAILKWTRNYISDFGGDPTNITLCGESSSAVDVALHLHSTLSRGQFDKGISQSGHPMNFRTILPKGVSVSRAWALARMTHCHNETVKTSEDLVECLRTIPAHEIVLKTYFLSYDYVLPHSVFGPVIEEKSAGAFLTSHPIQDHSKITNKVPWLLGVTTDEGSQKTLGLYSRKIWWNHIIGNYQRIFPELFSYEHLPNATNITEILIEKYVGEKPLIEAFEEISKMFGFCTVHLGSIEAAINYGGPTYFYHFDHLHDVPYVRIYLYLLRMYAKKKTGVIHGEEIRGLFYQPYLFPPVVKGPDRYVSDNLINFWYNFAAFSNPNGPRKGEQVWKPVRTKNLEYLYISGQDISMKSNPFWEEYHYWKNLSMPPLLTSRMLNDRKILSVFM